MALKCDLQYGRGDAGYKLTRVGVKGVRKPVLVHREGRDGTLNNALNCSIDIFVDNPLVDIFVQKRISDAQDNVDAAIAATRTVLARLEAMR